VGFESATPVRRIPAAGRFDLAFEYATAQTDTELQAAPGIGFALYVTDYYLVAKGAVDITIEEGASVLRFKYYANAIGDGVSKEFMEAQKLAENTALTLTTSAAIPVTVVVVGFIGPA
jgi:hypothetical protein